MNDTIRNISRQLRINQAELDMIQSMAISADRGNDAQTIMRLVYHAYEVHQQGKPTGADANKFLDEQSKAKSKEQEERKRA